MYIRGFVDVSTSYSERILAPLIDINATALKTLTCVAAEGHHMLDIIKKMAFSPIILVCPKILVLGLV